MISPEVARLYPSEAGLDFTACGEEAEIIEVNDGFVRVMAFPDYVSVKMYENEDCKGESLCHMIGSWSENEGLVHFDIATKHNGERNDGFWAKKFMKMTIAHFESSDREVRGLIADWVRDRSDDYCDFFDSFEIDRSVFDAAADTWTGRAYYDLRYRVIGEDKDNIYERGVGSRVKFVFWKEDTVI